MSANKTEFDSYDLEVSELVKLLELKVKDRIIIDKIERIDLEKQLLIGLKNYSYSELVSTIPKNIFLKLSNFVDIASTFKSYPTTFVFSQECEYDLEDYDYVYFSGDSLFHRITKVPSGFVYEYKGEFLTHSENVIVKVGQLIHLESDIEFKNVKFFGRYGTWKHGILTNNLLKEIYES